MEAHLRVCPIATLHAGHSLAIPSVVLFPRRAQVGSAESDEHDQLLDSVLVGPMQVGGYKIVFQAEPPDPRRIPGELLPQS